MESNELNFNYTLKKMNELFAKADESEIFTSEDKQKLATLENYDDSEVKSQISLNHSTLGYQRKNLLKNTAVSQTINGVTYTVNDDGSVTASGTATANAQIVIFDGKPDPETFNQKLHLSGCPDGGSASTYRMIIQNATSGFSTLCVDSGSGADLTIASDITHIRCLFTVYFGQTVENITLYPMLRYAEITGDSYEPYRDDLQTQIDNITTEKPYTLAAVYTRDLTSGEDLSKVTAPGVYRSATAAITNSLANKPDDLSSGFKMIVEVIQGASHVLQTIKSQAGKTYIRHLNLTSGAANNWFSLVSSDELADLEARVAALEGGGK